MDEGGRSKLSGIRQIVRLKEILQKWQNVTLTSKTSDSKKPYSDPKRTYSDLKRSSSEHNSAITSSGISPIINRRITNVIVCDSDEEGCQSPEPPHDVPKGYLAVYVGLELRRFIIPTSYLSHSLFKVLLEKAEDEYGFDHNGGLTIPCEIETFKYLLKCIENNPSTNSETLEE
ncbi:PREDICTED: auxin-responsive protein SAUR72-like [Lupinus angustifolius]|uniref:auxin-responsive protein SAUR72-like n=1 Tax=Lupinus angustifolius TaxID=3871 RepID=UPI00092E58F3|nr:PREDICTED: auxin-responsive protein SAUR72-like [Lupinus angustifolius]XP_019415914.1 PREDICTED: auxin-responsive protein SAUR72-like [Lupinus angustifolius]